jgi:hypothetical protein
MPGVHHSECTKTVSADRQTSVDGLQPCGLPDIAAA